MEESSFDFVEFVYDRLVKNFNNYILFEKTIPFREIYRICGLLFSLNKCQTKVLLNDIARRYSNVKRNCQGIKIFNC